MKLVLNKDYGGFGHGVADKYEDWVRDIEFESERTDPKLVEFVETHPNECGDLVIVEIPDESTDYYIDENDGFESVVYVVDGKLYWK